jgi:hypothetical protein
MNWDAIGAVAEAIGAIGVIGTLLFVALQVRHSARATEENSREILESRTRYSADSISRFSEFLASSREVASLWRRGAAGEELDPDETVQFFWLFRNFVQIHSTGFYLSDSGSSKQHSNIRILSGMISRNRGLQEAWPATARAFRNADRGDFVDAVEEALTDDANMDAGRVTR